MKLALVERHQQYVGARCARTVLASAFVRIAARGGLAGARGAGLGPVTATVHQRVARLMASGKLPDEDRKGPVVGSMDFPDCMSSAAGATPEVRPSQPDNVPHRRAPALAAEAGVPVVRLHTTAQDEDEDEH